MHTNQCTLDGLTQLSICVDALVNRCHAGQTPTAAELDELMAWNRLLKWHIRRQQQDPSGYSSDTYQYNQQTTNLDRVRKSGFVSSVL
jgi:hypothetical protein